MLVAATGDSWHVRIVVRVHGRPLAIEAWLPGTTSRIPYPFTPPRRLRVQGRPYQEMLRAACGGGPRCRCESSLLCADWSPTNQLVNFVREIVDTRAHLRRRTDQILATSVTRQCLFTHCPVASFL